MFDFLLRLRTLFYFCQVFYVFNVFNFYLNVFLHLWLQAPALSSKCGQRHVGSRGTRLNTYLLWLELVLGVIVRLFRTEIVRGLGSLGWRLGDKVRLGLRSGTEEQIGLSRGRGKCPYICPSASRRGDLRWDETALYHRDERRVADGLGAIAVLRYDTIRYEMLF